jgi:hypothetical protein
METSLVNAILIMFILAYVFSALIFMAKQKQGASFIASFDKAIVRGGCFFLLGSGLSFVVMMHGNLSQVFI